MSDEMIDVIKEYQRYETASGTARVRFLEAKLAAQAELQDAGYDATTARNLLKSIPSCLAFREFMSGATPTFDAREAADEILASPLARQTLGLREIEAKAAFLASLEKLKPADRITAARAAGIA